MQYSFFLQTHVFLIVLCSLLLLYGLSYYLFLACEDNYMPRQEPAPATVLLYVILPPQTALTSYCFRGSSWAKMCHWGQWEPAHHPAQEKEVVWTRWDLKSIMSPLTIMQIMRAHLRQAAATPIGCVPTWHVLACIPVLAHEHDFWCRFMSLLFVDAGVWKWRTDGCLEQWGQWGRGEMGVSETAERGEASRQEERWQVNVIHCLPFRFSWFSLAEP